jgi:exosortase A-associated hydrolase 2
MPAMSAPVCCDPAFVELAGRRCFVGRWRPRGVVRGSALLVQPFGDEAHLARRTHRRVAERLAGHGIESRIADLSCTGDSEGETIDASISQWRAELASLEARMLAEVSGPLVLVGGRFGALLALDRLACAAPRVAGAVVWAPIPDGGAQLKPYLRLLAVADVPTDGVKPADRARTEWAQGRSVRIAGIDFGPALVAELEALAAVPPVPGRPVVAIEVRDLAADQPLAPTPGAARVAAAWHAAGVPYRLESVRGAPFWNVPDPLDCDSLVERLVDAVNGALS